MGKLITEEYKDYNLIYDQDLVSNRDCRVIKKIISELLSDGDLKNLEVVNRHSRKNIDVYRFNEGQSGAGYFVKHYYMRRWDYYLKDMLVEPIGLGAFKKSLELIELGVPAAEPVAAVTIKGPAFKKDSILINREVANNLTLAKFLLANNLSSVHEDQVLSLFNELGRIFARMLNNRFFHTDSNPKNFLVQELDSGLEVFLIDIDDIFALSFLPLPEVIKLSTVASFLAGVKGRLVDRNSNIGQLIEESFLSGFLDVYSCEKENNYIKLKIKKLLEEKLNRRS